MDDHTFRNVMGKFATGITVVTTEAEGQTYGMTANAFMSVSLNPKLILVSIDKRAKILSRLQGTKMFAVSFLDQDQQKESMRFAGQLKEDAAYQFDRQEGLPVIKNSLASLICKLYKEIEAGDHILFIGEVTNLKMGAGEPLIYYSGKYRRLAKEENPEKAEQ